MPAKKLPLWKFILIMCLLWGIAGLLVVHYHETPYTSSYQSGVIHLPSENVYGTCVAADLLAAVKVYNISDFPNKDQVGGYYPESSAIVLTGFDLNTVAHEVSHFVDYVVEEKHIHDGETRAYLQGYFTDCVYNLKWGLKEIKITN